MPRRHVRLTAPAGPELAASFADLRRSLGVAVDFPPDVVAEAEASVRSARPPERDDTAVPFATIDPPQSRDLDQAFHLERRNGGYRVRYAIADVAAFVAPGTAVDREAHVRGQTFYAPDGNARLYPPVLSEGAASLLPGETRPALVWTMDVDESGEGVEVSVRRARVRSRAKLDYASAQRALDDGDADESLQLLREVGLLRQKREARLGGIQLPIPEQEVEKGADGYELSFRAPLPVEGWNAQISLMTGQAAAELMTDARLGILKTMPQASRRQVERLRRTAAALGVTWDDGVPLAEFIRGLDPTRPPHAALLNASTSVLRGSAYVAFEGEPPAQAEHAGVGAEYAHTTAPLRRLVDRYVGEICTCVSSGEPVPDWVRAALPELPETMEKSNQRAHQFEAGIVSAVEAAVLERHVGETFDAVVVEADEDGDGGLVQLREPAVTARCNGELPLGERVRVRLELADVARRQVRFELA